MPLHHGRTPRVLARRMLLLPLVVVLAMFGHDAIGTGDPAERDRDDVSIVSPDVQFRAIHKLKVDILWQSARGKFAAAKQAARAKKSRRGRTGARSPLNVKPAPEDLQPLPSWPPRVVDPDAVLATGVVPANIRANDPLGDGAGTGQAEESVAAWGDHVVVAWNDGQGFNTGGDQQGFAWSVDGGVTFQDGGEFPKPISYPGWKWTSDPVVTVNEKTGRFYYSGLGNPDATHNAIGVVAFTLGPGGPVFDPVRVVRVATNLSTFLDKQWIAADSVSGRLHLVYSTFTSTNWIDYQSSSNEGVNWSAPLQISDPADNGFVQGARVVMGPPVTPGMGRAHAVWSAIGQTTNEDFLRHRSSDNGGVAWSAPATVASYIANFGTGAPAFNRERGIHFPSVAVDRTHGIGRGRIYVAWNESYDHLNDLFNNPSVAIEAEPNGTAPQATPFTIGQILRGTTSSVNPTDFDYFSVPLLGGQSLILWADSLVDQQTYTLRVFAPTPDDNQRLGYGGDVIPGAVVTGAYYTITAPVTGTYYVRFAPAYTDPAKSKIGPYRIRTKSGSRGSERGRDQRDVFVTASDDGITWTTPVRVNDSLTGFDEYLPEVAVGPDGGAYLMWRDHRNDTYGSRTHQYMACSFDGGLTWSANRRLTDTQGNFSTSSSNIAPNLGDYNALFGGGRYLHAAWADGRDTHVDVWSARMDTEFDVIPTPPQEVAPGQTLFLSWLVDNHNPLFTSWYQVSGTPGRNWHGTATTVASAPADSLGQAVVTIEIPDSAAAGPATVAVTTRALRGTLTRSFTAQLVVNPALLSVGGGRSPAFAINSITPNPAHNLARLDFTLPASAHVRLSIHDPQGKRVRTLVEGERPAGRHGVSWDGRDQQGHPIAPGAYFCRLESQGRTVSRRLTWMR